MTEPAQDDSQTTTLQQWQGFKSQAENGELRMEEGVAGQLVERCNTFIDQLETALGRARQLQLVSGFGDLRSAQALRTKFSNKAFKDPDSAANRLKMSIDIAVLMRETFELAGKQIAETDQSTSTALGNAGA